MNTYIALIFVELCLISKILSATIEEDRQQVFAASGDQLLKPAETYQCLIRLSDAYSQYEEYIDERQEISDLIGVAEVTKEKCNREFMDLIDNMLFKYGQSSLNLIPYLQGCKRMLISECDVRYDIKILTSEAKFIEQPEYHPESDNEATELEGISSEASSNQRSVDENWTRRYKEVFYKENEQSSSEDTINLLNLLSQYLRFTSQSMDIKQLGQQVTDLMQISFTLAKNCNNENFAVFDELIEKYSKGYSSSIVEYIQFHRSKLWQICKQAFLNCLKSGDTLSQQDKTEMMSLVDHVSASLSYPIYKFWLVLDSDSMEPGIISYIRDKLGNKKAHKLKYIEKLFDTTIKPICNSVNFVFAGKGKLAEIIEFREDFKRELRMNDLKWLTAITICEMIRSNHLSIQNKAHSILSEQHQDTKSNLCFGKLLCKN